MKRNTALIVAAAAVAFTGFMGTAQAATRAPAPNPAFSGRLVSPLARTAQNTVVGGVPAPVISVKCFGGTPPYTRTVTPAPPAGV